MISSLCIIAVILFIWILKRYLIRCGIERNQENGKNSLEMRTIRGNGHEEADRIIER